MAEDFKASLIRRIRSGGPMRGSEYMARCVAHYYASRDPFGAKGDFMTAPEISQIFGELIGAWVAQAWQDIGSPKASLYELGPGRGTLMKDILRATRNVPGFHEAIEVCLVENSPALQKIQQQVLEGTHPRIRWQDTLTPLPELPVLLVANEFFDALPVVQTVHGEERKVSYGDDAFFWVPDGDVTRETSLESIAIMRQLARHIAIREGAALIIDYGYAQGEQGDTLQAVKGHAYADPMSEPGEADITAHVDFAALLEAAALTGAHAWGAVEQGEFLKRLGAQLRADALCASATSEQQQSIRSGLERLMVPMQMGRLFKVIALTSSFAKPAGF